MRGTTVRSDQEAARRRKITAVRASGGDPFPARSARDTTCHDAVVRFDEYARTKRALTLAGRVRGLRVHGGSTFAHLEDGTGRFQVFLSRGSLGVQEYDRAVDTIDLGDFVEAHGTLFTTRRGEKTLEAKTTRLIAKAVKPLPEQWHGLSDVEIRYRHRELDLIANPEVRGFAQKRSALVTAVRKFLDERGILEVETPILQPVPGGATARPFTTQHNTLKQTFYLRVAPELYLKRLIVGGFPAVYEVARCFRNEGVDHAHNPEFTQIELYVAYRDADWMQKFFTELLVAALTEITGGTRISYEGQELDFAPPYASMRFGEALSRYGGLQLAAPDAEFLRAIRASGGRVERRAPRIQLLDGALKHVIRPQLKKPTFLTHYPVELSPLAKRDSEDPAVAQHWQFFAGGLEIARAFSELNDPDDQRSRFLDQEKLRAAGDEEAQRIDDNYLEALRAGMPPTAGLGFGIDRLSLLVTGAHSLKEVILFPTLKSKNTPDQQPVARKPGRKRA
jgi:lysyl-tRNA synthetase class 2